MKTLVSTVEVVIGMSLRVQVKNLAKGDAQFMVIMIILPPYLPLAEGRPAQASSGHRFPRA